MTWSLALKVEGSWQKMATYRYVHFFRKKKVNVIVTYASYREISDTCVQGPCRT
jgi:hypothetical protein